MKQIPKLIPTKEACFFLHKKSIQSDGYPVWGITIEDLIDKLNRITDHNGNMEYNKAVSVLSVIKSSKMGGQYMFANKDFEYIKSIWKRMYIN